MADDIKTQVAAAVRSARLKKKLSQVKLAEQVGLSMEAISHIERAASIPSLETFAALVTALSLDPAKVIGVRSGRATSRERARIEAEVAAFLEGLNDRDAERWLELGRVMVGK